MKIKYLLLRQLNFYLFKIYLNTHLYIYNIGNTNKYAHMSIYDYSK
ncbi:hypothetical protein [Plasmodium yoelii yoelii]|uniref:Uncharacterized protein n=1 Tax=Plasmodium yoelii yoelii TaxID=73239 RepID=Q7RAR6_PLAYO|nr:hypothetical protein [Plasmodium yoelii yoelii]